VQIDVRGAPGRSKGVPASISGLQPRKPGPQIFSQTAFRYPEERSNIRRGPPSPPSGPWRSAVGPQSPCGTAARRAATLHGCTLGAYWVPEGSLAKNFRAAISWHPEAPARLPSGSQAYEIPSFFKGRNWLVWRSGEPGGPGDPSTRWGRGPAAQRNGHTGPRGRPDPQNDRSPILEKIQVASQSAATSGFGRWGCGDVGVGCSCWETGRSLGASKPSKKLGT